MSLRSSSFPPLEIFRQVFAAVAAAVAFRRSPLFAGFLFMSIRSLLPLALQVFSRDKTNRTDSFRDSWCACVRAPLAKATIQLSAEVSPLVRLSLSGALSAPLAPSSPFFFLRAHSVAASAAQFSAERHSTAISRLSNVNRDGRFARPTNPSLLFFSRSRLFNSITKIVDSCIAD